MPALPAVVKDRGSQENFDAANKRLEAAEKNASAVEAKFPVSDANLASPVVRGRIGKMGTVALGSGFSAKKLSTGNYEITLGTELLTEGVMVATGIENFHAALIVTESSKKVFKVGNWNNALAQEDTAFNFMVMAS